MYHVPDYKDPNPEAVLEFIQQHPFAFLSGCNAQNQPVATQVPVFLEEEQGKRYLRGHLMKHTDHHRAFAEQPQVLAVFTGPNTYVSGTWYSKPATPSTWNYMSVHCQGVIRFLDDAGLQQLLQKTTLHFEDHRAESPTVFDNLPADYMQRLMKAIVGFEIEVTQMDHVFKLSQDRDEASYQNIVQRLLQGDAQAQAIAYEMKKRYGDLFLK